MKEYKIFQWEDRTLMCVEVGDSSYFTNKIIFSVEGIKLQIKRKGCKVKVKVLELSEEFYGCENGRFEIYKSNVYSTINSYNLAVHLIGDKVKHTFPTEQEAIDWVEALFSLRGE